jgi:hypothetical protein
VTPDVRVDRHALNLKLDHDHDHEFEFETMAMAPAGHGPWPWFHEVHDQAAAEPFSLNA